MNNKIFSLFGLLASVFSLFLIINSVQASDETPENTENYDFYYQDFLVSAYYSPLPNQSRYIRGSYEADIKLNGRGTNAADGVEVFMGLLAAPKSYAFGTNIEIPGLGMGEVHDRGGAIVAQKNYHRIDVWMGQGEEGLSRALNWGMRYVTGKVYFVTKTQTVTLNYTNISSSLPVVAKKNTPPALFLGKIQYGDINSNVVKLKEILAINNYFHGETQNNYFDDELKKAIINFQIDQGIIKKATDYGAGYVGSDTQNKLQQIANNKNNPTVVNSAAVSSVSAKEEAQIAIQAGTSKNSSLDDVKSLQLILSNLGYFNQAIDGQYSDELVQAIFAFQKDQKIISSEYDYGAGHFGPKTQNALNQVLENKLTKLKSYPVSKAEIILGVENNSTNVIDTENNDTFPNVKQTIYQTDLNTKEKSQELKDYLAQKGFLEFNHNSVYFGSHRFKEVNMTKAEIINNK